MPDNDTFRDWIPEGEDTGAITKDGFQDFVPDPEPKPQTITEEQPVAEPVEEVQEAEELVVASEEPVVPPLEPVEEAVNGEVKE
jgi:hypothetical protein